MYAHVSVNPPCGVSLSAIVGAGVVRLEEGAEAVEAPVESSPRERFTPFFLSGLLAAMVASSERRRPGMSSNPLSLLGKVLLPAAGGDKPPPTKGPVPPWAGSIVLRRLPGLFGPVAADAAPLFAPF